MSLVELINNATTDKNTVHSYLQLYEVLLQRKKHTAKNVLEIGVANGGSIKLWHDYFSNATIYGIDIVDDMNFILEKTITNNDKIKLFMSTDGYVDDFVVTNFLNKNVQFDFMLDDGPHTLESMMTFINLYSQIMTDDGILIIEDVQSWNWIYALENAVPTHLKQFIKIYDLRSNKNRYDDIVFTIDKSGS